jgi:hypothetical protein
MLMRCSLKLVTQYSMGIFGRNFHKVLGEVLVLFKMYLDLLQIHLDILAAGVVFTLM